jgi:hypothetical protein
MTHRVLAAAIVIALFAGPAFATDIDRHGNYTEGTAGAAATKCKNFTGTDDNRGNCTDWCSTYTTANAGTTCNCDEGACPEAQPASDAAAASGPVASH